MASVLSRVYRGTLKKVSWIDDSAVMDYAKKGVAVVGIRARLAAELRRDRRQIHCHVFTAGELEAWRGLLARLDLQVDEHVALARVIDRMLLKDFEHFLALLRWFEQQPKCEPSVSAPAVVRGADLNVAPLSRERRKILFITGEFPSPWHGGGGRVIDFIKLLSRDHDVDLYAWDSGRARQVAFDTLKACCRRLEQVPIEGFEDDRERLARFVGNSHYDFVHYEWPRSLKNYDRAWGRHHIFTYMEAVSLRLLMDLSGRAAMSRSWCDTMVQLLDALHSEMVSSAQMDAHIAVTCKDAEFLSHLDATRHYVVVNHGINLDEYILPDVAPEAHTVTFVGNFMHYPNVDAMGFFFRQVFPQVLERVPELKLYLVGANPPPLIRRLGDGKRVIVTGAVEDFRPFVQRASVCIAPLVNGAGLRSKVVQYAALRRACVATRIAATDLNFEDGKGIWIADDGPTFADRLAHALLDPQLAQRVGQAAFVQSAAYDNAKHIQELYRLYALLEQRAGPGA